MKTAKLGAILMVSLMALAGTSAAYALWYEDLYIWTDINTGTVDVEWSVGKWWVNQTKPVSTCELYIDPDNENILRCFIWNAYPCVDYYFYFDLHCVGSIPVHFTPMYLLGGTLNRSWVEDMELFIDRIVWANGTVKVFDPPVAIWTIQLHHDDTAYGHYMIHFNNNLPQNSKFTFDFKTTAYQYNEDDYWD